MRNTGLGTSIGLVAVGAILAWAVSYEVSAIDINMVGLILFGVGFLGIAVILATTSGSHRTVIQQREVVRPPEAAQQVQQPMQVQQQPNQVQQPQQRAQQPQQV